MNSPCDEAEKIQDLESQKILGTYQEFQADQARVLLQLWLHEWYQPLYELILDEV